MKTLRLLAKRSLFCIIEYDVFKQERRQGAHYVNNNYAP